MKRIVIMVIALMVLAMAFIPMVGIASDGNPEEERPEDERPEEEHEEERPEEERPEEEGRPDIHMIAYRLRMAVEAGEITEGEARAILSRLMADDDDSDERPEEERPDDRPEEERPEDRSSEERPEEERPDDRPDDRRFRRWEFRLRMDQRPGEDRPDDRPEEDRPEEDRPEEERPEEERPEEETDSDRDGYSDEIELRLGTDPNNSSSVPDEVPGRTDHSIECGIMGRDPDGEAPYVMIYVDGITIELTRMDENVMEWIIDADFDEGKTLFVRFTVPFLADSDEKFTFSMDGQEIEQAPLEDVIDADGEAPLFALIEDRSIGNDTYFAIYVPHFSAHSFTLEKVMGGISATPEEVIGTMSIAAVIAAIATIMVLALNVVRIGKRKD